MWDNEIFTFYFKAKIKLLSKLVINQQVSSIHERVGEDHLEMGTKLAPHSLPHLVPHGNPLAPNLPLIHGPMARAKPRAKPEPGPSPARNWPAPGPSPACTSCCCGMVRLRLLPWCGAAAAVPSRGWLWLQHGALARLAPSIRMLGALRC